LRLRVGMGDVDEVQEQVCFGDLLQRGTECSHQQGRKLLDESYGISEQGDIAAAQFDAARGRIEGSEELVSDVDVGIAQLVQQGGFPGVGISNQGNDRDFRALTSGAILLAVGADFLELLFEVVDAPADITAVDLKLDPDWTVNCRGKSIRLTRLEYRILRELALHLGKVMPHEELIQRVWGYNGEASSNILKGHVRNIRMKLENLGSDTTIRIMPGVGYILSGGEA